MRKQLHGNGRWAFLAASAWLAASGAGLAWTSAGFLGPANPGAENDAASWYYGVQGAAFLLVDKTNAASGGHDFTLGNTQPGKDNAADWRSEPFDLGCAAAGKRQVIFSFVYKLPGDVLEGDNMEVDLRFFDKEARFLGQKRIYLGTATRDSRMTRYKTVTRKLRPPRAAFQGDVWVTANRFGAWTSGAARFDDFSVMAVLPWYLRAEAIIAVALPVALVLSAAIWTRTRRSKI